MFNKLNNQKNLHSGGWEEEQKMRDSLFQLLCVLSFAGGMMFATKHGNVTFREAVRNQARELTDYIRGLFDA